MSLFLQKRASLLYRAVYYQMLELLLGFFSSAQGSVPWHLLWSSLSAKSLCAWSRFAKGNVTFQFLSRNWDFVCCQSVHWAVGNNATSNCKRKHQITTTHFSRRTSTIFPSAPRGCWCVNNFFRLQHQKGRAKASSTRHQRRTPAYIASDDWQEERSWREGLCKRYDKKQSHQQPHPSDSPCFLFQKRFF